MDCRQANEGIALYVGEDLPEPERALLEDHLAGCEECRAELERYRAAFLPWQGTGETDAPVPDAEKLWAGIAGQVTWATRPARPRRGLRLVRTLASLAAVLVLGVGIGYVAMRIVPPAREGAGGERSVAVDARPFGARPDFRSVPVDRGFLPNDVLTVDTGSPPVRRFFLGSGASPRGGFRGGLEVFTAPARPDCRYHLEQIQSVQSEDIVAGY